MNRFDHNDEPTTEMVDAFGALRAAAKELETVIERDVTNGRHKALALTNLEQAMMWANKGVAHP